LPPVLSLAAVALALSAPARGQEPPLVTTSDSQDSFYCEERRLGYWFYCTRPKPHEGAGGDIRACCERDEPARCDHGKLRELKAKAILEPTPANVTAYIRFQRAQLDRASLFSDVWQRAIWQDPDLDYTLQRPVSTLGKRQWQDSRNAERNAVMAQLSERYGLFYFFAQSCGACEVMSPIVQSVASTWHITVRAISTDGGPRGISRTTRSRPTSAAAWGLSPRSRQRSCCGTPPRASPSRSATA
jgi:conjugal transfer pilus assembly protein TraF